MSGAAPFATAEETGRRLAEEHAPGTAAGGYGQFRGRLRVLRRRLRRLDQHLERDPARGRPTARAVEWLLDNAYLVATAVRQVAIHLPRRFYGELPKLEDGGGGIRTRIEHIAAAVVEAGDGVVDVEQLRRLIDGYQRVTTLNIGELWALPALLRLRILEDLGELAETALDDRDGTAGNGAAEFETRVANRVQSLHRLDATDWKGLVESLSAVDRILRGEPDGVFSRMDFGTRDRYRRSVEELARWAGVPEVAVARQAVESAAGAAPSDPRLRHVGCYLVDREGRPPFEERLGCRVPVGRRLARGARRHALLAYLGAIAAVTVALVAGVAALAGTTWPWVAVLALMPAASVAVGVVNLVVTHSVSPLPLPKLDARHGIPAGCPTAVVIPALLGSHEEVDGLLARLETNVQGNRDDQVSYVLLTDFQDATEPTTSADAGLIARLAAGVRRLNREHRSVRGTTFHLLHRARRWNPSEARWMGWERKRGKLAQFNRLLLDGPGEEDELQTVVGDPQRLVQTRFVITLDADTVLPQGTAARLVGAMAHPLNRARFDDRGRVAGGYTILQPRLEIAPSSQDETLFARAFQQDTTLDLYSRAVSDVYQDLFDEGTYVGKGIYDVAAFERSLAGRVPDNALLSHDLLEGAHGRSGLLSDVILLEDYPATVLAYYRRVHRWARGDWQLLPWLLPRVPAADGGRLANRISALNRWKMLDNLRRTLLPPAIVAMLLAGWLGFPGDGWLWTGVALAALATPILLGVLSWARDTVHGAAPRTSTATWLQHARWDAVRWIFQAAFLAYDAGVRLDATIRTVLRVWVTRRHLLEWTSAAHDARALRGQGFTAFWGRMWPAPAAAAATGAGLIVAGSPALLPAAPLLLLWLLSPAIAWVVSRPPAVRAPPPADLAAMRRLARRTWRFFESHLGPEQHWLMPDHVQDEPGMGAVHRTSPTNLGMALVAVVTAYDFGYLDRRRLTATLGIMLERMAGLETYRGHLLNWYDTRIPTPLEPRYVSTVDSGNLAASLLVVQEACADVARDPLLTAAQAQGLADTIRAEGEAVTSLARVSEVSLVACRRQLAELVEEVEACPATPQARWQLLNRLMTEALPGLEAQLEAGLEGTRPGAEPSQGALAWLAELHRHAGQQREWMEHLLPWAAVVAEPPTALGEPPLAGRWSVLEAFLAQPPALEGTPRHAERAAELLAELEGSVAASDVTVDHRREVQAWIRRLRDGLAAGAEAARELVAELEAVRNQADALFEGMDFRFLYDRGRQQFRIGHDVSAGHPDPNHYDLLASEARVASLVAIAKGDVPTRHWLHLRRPLGRIQGRRIALSWGGTMFEFLMPALFLETPPRTLLDRSCRTAIRQQMAFARATGTPWGISESAYSRRDAHGTYQYRAFGVPGTGLRRDLGDRIVVAPYASALALPFDPQAVLTNLSRIEALGGLGRFGLVEAIDYGRADTHQGRGYVIPSYMAHHQGMVLAALSNAVHGHRLVRRMHRDPRIASAAPLLHERLPQGVPTYRTRRRALPEFRPQAAPGLEGWTVDVQHPIPQLHLLANGRYSVIVDARGGSGSRWRRDTALTRWRTEPAPDLWGQRLYLEDLDSGRLHLVARDQGNHGSTRFAPHQAEFVATHADLRIHTRLTVAPRVDVELRLLSIRNEGSRARRIALTSYAEVALAGAAEDRRHQAFTKLFVDARPIPELAALLFHRRPRAAGQPGLNMGHAVVASRPLASEVTWETDRARFLGPAGDLGHPEALREGAGLGGRPGPPLDPIWALRAEVILPPDSSTEVAFVTAAAANEPEILTLLNAFRSTARIETAFGEAAAYHDLQVREAGSTAEELQVAQALFSAVVHPFHALRMARRAKPVGCRGQSALWAHGISGDLPLVAVSVDAEGDIPLVAEVLRAQRHWRAGGARVDVVLIDEQTSGYDTPVRHAIQRAIEEALGDVTAAQAGVFVVAAAQLGDDERAAIECSARVYLIPDGRPLAQHLEALRHRPAPLPDFVPIPSSPPADLPTPPLKRPEALEFDNGFGGFASDGREYVIFRDRSISPPRRWSNIVANPDFGFLVTDAGGGYTWAGNSAENRLTPWRNDPLQPPPGEALYLRDEETGEIWSPTPAPAGTDGPYLVRHGAGYTVFHHHAHGLEQELALFVHPEAPVKFLRLRLRNRWPRQRRITATCFVEWVLGSVRDVTAPHVSVRHDAETDALLARCAFNETSGERVAFLAASRGSHGHTCDRTEFLGTGLRWARPAGLERIGLSGAAGPGVDPCGALQVHLDIAPGESVVTHFLLGEGQDTEDALRLAAHHRRPEAAQSAWEANGATWRDRLERVEVRTPDRALDLMLNHWLPYQTLASRYFARTGLFQSSGAFGFRDQLQDVLAIQWLDPALTRRHLLEAARHQFQEGDVLHWWHPLTEAGVRTRCSDDLLWLPYVVAHYVATTGDLGVLEAREPFLEGPVLEPGEEQRFTRFLHSAAQDTLYEHCRRALDAAWSLGAHDLPLIGTGDWNDGYDRVGREGRGESVWLAWFQHATLQAFAELSARAGRPDDHDRFAERAERLREAAEQHAWDGRWYLRAFFDDGTPLGTAEAAECRIDSTAQTWAVLSGAAAPARAREAMAAVWDELVRPADRLVLLLTPPFERRGPDPGYIRGYPPGVRENGAQYTHAATWVAWAFAELGEHERALAVVDLLNPIHHAASRDAAGRYEGEPYVLAGDVLAAPDHLGQAGWTWYTGSAGWLYRLGIERVLGLRRRGDVLELDPRIPHTWPGFEVTWRVDGTRYRIRVAQADGGEHHRVTLDGQLLDDGPIPLAADGATHDVQVQLGAGARGAPERQEASRHA